MLWDTMPTRHGKAFSGPVRFLITSLTLASAEAISKAFSLKELKGNMQISTDGIILNRRSYGDDDRQVVILTGECGVLYAYAKGAKRLRSKFASSTELLCYDHFVIFRSKDSFFLDRADPERLFFGIRQDIEKLSLASYLAELTIELAPKQEPARDYLKLLLNTLHYLEKDLLPAAQLKALYELRLLTMAGYMPDLVGCKNCGSFEEEEFYFSPYTGELLCGDCFRSVEDFKHKEGFYPIGRGVLAAMRHILYTVNGKLFSFQLSADGLRALERICQDYLHCQVEKTFQSLKFYTSLI